ncbi:MAG: MFS transporter [Ottowia sp.]|uniref:MFS transporter n=1 Tax=Ottowia sp. TaxID=1898956 RepID=UPI003C710184
MSSPPPPAPSSQPQAGAPANSSEALRARYGERYRWLLLMTVMMGTVASVMSSTVVNVAIPGLSHHFGLGQDRAQWVTSGFMVAMTVSMLTTPWLLARFGYRATYAGCMWLLMAGGLGGGFAQDFPLVLAARVAEGLAAGVVQPIPAIIIMRAFQPQEQGRAIGLFTMGVVLAPALGPSIGGVLVDWFGWRSIFFMVVPFCIASLWLGRRFVPATAPGGAVASRSEALDWAGLALGTAGTLSLLDGLVSLRAGPPIRAAGLLALAGICFGIFLWWQARRTRLGQASLMNLRLFAWRPFAMGSLVTAIYGTALFGSTYLLPVYMQMGLGLSASSVGMVLLPSGLVLAGAIAIVSRLADRLPANVLVSTGLAILTLSFALMVTLGPSASLWMLIAYSAIGRIGLGFILPSLNLGSMRGLEKDLISQASSVINFIRMLGGAAGVSLCAIALEWRLASHGASLAGGTNLPARLAAFNEVFLMLAALCALAMLAARYLGSHSRLQNNP